MKYPTCTATATSLTCTGSAVNVRNPPWLPVAVITAITYYTCLGGTNDGLVVESVKVGSASMKNGKPFTVTLAVDPTDPSGVGDSHSTECEGGSWLRLDPNYYNVTVQAGISYGGYEFGGALFAHLGTISPA